MLCCFKCLKAGLVEKLTLCTRGWLQNVKIRVATNKIVSGLNLTVSVWQGLTCKRQVTCSSSRRCFIKACSTSQPEAVDPVPKPVPLAQYNCCSSLDTPLWLDVCGCPNRPRTHKVGCENNTRVSFELIKCYTIEKAKTLSLKTSESKRIK